MFSNFWKLIFVLSLVVNVGLSIFSFVLQPIWFAAELAEKVAVVKAAETLARKKAVSKEKAKARLRRVLVAVPVAGVAAAGYFEYAQYQKWLEENSGGEFNGYAAEVGSDTQEVADEVLQELPEAVRPNDGALDRLVARSLEAMSKIRD
ncbi:hypothetical protein [uncultured Litoreibacter sp.]|uniref:hypothetical protein n=1 Tax=uncultured Litoreibacter sp. TaxID=1392394 RepID=UPI00261EB3AB|nr:hypothetical protein [uncultured Litoreibacter sp.]